MAKCLKDAYRQVVQINENGLKTPYTQLWVHDFQIFIKSSDPNEVKVILQIFSAITRTLRLK